MSIGTGTRIGAALPTPSALSTLEPLDARQVEITGGLWAERLRTNRERTIPHGHHWLVEAGTLQNFRLAAGETGPYRALGVMFAEPFPFLDSDVYKWLEAVGWVIGREPEERLAEMADEAITLVQKAQRSDGYINTFVQVTRGGHAFQDLAWGHELYCFGHLIQAAVAWHRAVGDDRLLDVAIGAADCVDREFGPDGRLAIEGHPEIETALVELFRVTGAERYLDLAARLVEARGHGLLGDGRFGAAYWQDHEPVRQATEPAGHAVRQLYLDAGAVDVAVERADRELLDAVHRRWRDMVATRMYVTGGLGSRHKDEAFGDPYELPPDRAYAETCASIASVMLAWRLLLATGDPACADVIERTMLNGVLSGLSLDGTAFFYTNPLQRRTHRAPGTVRSGGTRAPWYPCACCPPNLMRILGSWPGYLATRTDAGLQIQQYASTDLAVDVADGRVRLATETDYPWSGTVTVRVVETPDRRWTLSLRVPAWSRNARLEDPDGVVDGIGGAGPTVIERSRTWRAGDTLTLDLGLNARATRVHPRVDAVRGALAIERGPLVYCIETVDVPAGSELEDVSLPLPLSAQPARANGLPESVVGLRIGASVRRSRPDRPARPGEVDASALYREADASDHSDEDVDPTATTARIEIGAIPYFSWANRDIDAMRVWIPEEPPA